MPASGDLAPRQFIASKCVLLERYLIGADMEFHLEHHLNPAIPHYRLRQLNRDLERRGVFERIGKHRAKVLSDGYLKFWLRLVERKKENGTTTRS